MEPDWLRPQLVPNDRRQARGTTTCETYLGLHHRPMSYVHGDTLITCFLSSDPTLRAHETDLLREFDRKNEGF
ncbi:MAG: hypothetical protein DMG69_29820 [Acidobacteria bacterium]|nr:MAG: hypothetical protein DMG69_29820 [Acidobacteriota bacterium]